MCGTYWLHVGLRQSGTQLPGSPFLLSVFAGPASALSTALPSESLPLQGVAGDDEAAGCRVLLRAADKSSDEASARTDAPGTGTRTCPFCPSC